MPCPSCYNGSAPSAVPSVTVNQLTISDDDWEVVRETFAATTGDEVTLSEDPITGYEILVFADGLMVPASIADRVVTLDAAVTAADVVVRYARLV